MAGSGGRRGYGIWGLVTDGIRGEAEFFGGSGGGGAAEEEQAGGLEAGERAVEGVEKCGRVDLEGRSKRHGFGGERGTSVRDLKRGVFQGLIV